jgi:hypothetical protein
MNIHGMQDKPCIMTLQQSPLCTLEVAPGWEVGRGWEVAVGWVAGRGCEVAGGNRGSNTSGICRPINGVSMAVQL